MYPWTVKMAASPRRNNRAARSGWGFCKVASMAVLRRTTARDRCRPRAGRETRPHGCAGSCESSERERKTCAPAIIAPGGARRKRLTRNGVRPGLAATQLLHVALHLRRLDAVARFAEQLQVLRRGGAAA